MKLIDPNNQKFEFRNDMYSKCTEFDQNIKNFMYLDPL